MIWQARTPNLVADRPRPERGLLDTSVVIDLERISADELPSEVAISAITMAELTAGPHATNDPAERSRRQDRLQRTEAAFDPLPFNTEAARAYGGARAVDLLIAATALAEELPLYTRNPDDFRALDGIVDVIRI